MSYKWLLMAAIEFIQSTWFSTSKVNCKLFFVENLSNSLSVYNSLLHDPALKSAFFETFLCPKCSMSVVISSGRIEETGCSFCFQGGVESMPYWLNTIMHLCASTAAAASTKGILCYNFTIQFKVFTSIQG